MNDEEFNDEELDSEVKDFIDRFWLSLKPKFEKQKFSPKQINLILNTIHQAIEEAKET